jgi:5'-3' exonuclease
MVFAHAPTAAQVDTAGMRFAWMGVALLPFIDETRLLQAAASVNAMGLTPEVRDCFPCLFSLFPPMGG